MADPLGSKSPLGSSRELSLAMWRLPLLRLWFAEDRIVLDSTFWQFGFPSFVLDHFFLLGVSLGLKMEWAEVSRTFWPHNNIFITNFRSLVVTSFNLNPPFKLFFCPLH